MGASKASQTRPFESRQSPRYNLSNLRRARLVDGATSLESVGESSTGLRGNWI